MQYLDIMFPNILLKFQYAQVVVFLKMDLNSYEAYFIQPSSRGQFFGQGIKILCIWIHQGVLCN
jgi:hypothetical protein